MIQFARPISICASVVFSLLYTVSASAYIFGPPNVTELAEPGQSANNLSIFTRTEEDPLSGAGSKSESKGIAGVVKNGDKSGAGTFMYRLSQNSSTTSTLTRDGTDFGFGLGGEWNLLSDRSLGLIANFQYDAGYWEYTKGSTNTGTALTLGGEIGGIYRIFVETVTIAPFVMYNQFYSSYRITPATGADWSLYNKGGSTSFGVGIIAGKFTVSFTQTRSNSEISNSYNSATSKTSTDGTMLTLGVNF
ncbi:MAG TPA: hypothetical protein VMV48_11440 [Gallionellaceae bacterium]|nr:hypothetical protein [Gallionellaceae bacterium]